MNWNNLIQASLYLLVLLLAVKPLGIYMARIYERQSIINVLTPIRIIFSSIPIHKFSRYSSTG